MHRSGTEASRQPLIRLEPAHDSLYRLLPRPLLSAAERLLGLEELNRRYRRVAPHEGLRGFLDEAFRVLGLSHELSPTEAARIPASGPLVVVANHPYGAAEGLVLARALLAVRPDVKIFGNYLLSRIEELRELFLFVDPFDRKGSAAANVRPLREALRWLRAGGALGVFPSGEVSHFQLKKQTVSDPPWSHTIGRLIRASHASALPVHFPGHNGVLFQLAGLLHPRLRTALLPRALLKRTAVSMCVGKALPWDHLRELGSDADLMSYLRLRTELLAGAACAPRSCAPRFGRKRPSSRREPVAREVPRHRLSAEVAQLPPSHLLAESGPFAVFRACCGEIPATLQEIGRLREATFRAAGEGTGRPVDLDRFDESYMHLFVWDRSRENVVGAYRLGQTDEILKRSGMEGLYTATLFRYRPEFFERVGPALEMGRSFVREEYQRSFHPMLLLWKGIGSMVAQAPRYRALFGAVSISQEYTDASREIMTRFLLERMYRDDLAPLVRSRTPFRPERSRAWDPAWARLLPAELDELSRWVCDIEGPDRGVPVLIRQYAKLGGRMLGFNVDSKFQNALDGLVLVDLISTPLRILERYLGTSQARSFLQFHGLADPSQARDCA